MQTGKQPGLVIFKGGSQLFFAEYVRYQKGNAFGRDFERDRATSASGFALKERPTRFDTDAGVRWPVLRIGKRMRQRQNRPTTGFRRSGGLGRFGAEGLFETLPHASGHSCRDGKAMRAFDLGFVGIVAGANI